MHCVKDEHHPRTCSSRPYTAALGMGRRPIEAPMRRVHPLMHRVHPLMHRRHRRTPRAELLLHASSRAVRALTRTPMRLINGDIVIGHPHHRACGPRTRTSRRTRSRRRPSMTRSKAFKCGPITIDVDAFGSFTACDAPDHQHTAHINGLGHPSRRSRPSNHASTTLTGCE